MAYRNPFFMKRLFSIVLSSTLFLLLSSVAFAGAGATGSGILRHEPCTKDNLLIFGHESEEEIGWPYRVEEPDYCIHIYPDGDLHEFYYTLPKDARKKTGYYSEDSSVDVLDTIPDGAEVIFKFGITGGENSFLITDAIGIDVYALKTVTPEQKPLPQPTPQVAPPAPVIPPAGF